MHDTPSKGAFGRFRFLEPRLRPGQGVFITRRGCWRRGWRPSRGWDKTALQAKIKEGARYDINLTKAVAVIWVTLPAGRIATGRANFRDDVYNVDNVGGAQLSAQAAPVRFKRPSAAFGRDRRNLADKLGIASRL